MKSEWTEDYEIKGCETPYGKQTDGPAEVPSPPPRPGTPHPLNSGIILDENAADYTPYRARIQNVSLVGLGSQTEGRLSQYKVDRIRRWVDDTCYELENDRRDEGNSSTSQDSGPSWSSRQGKMAPNSKLFTIRLF